MRTAILTVMFALTATPLLAGWATWEDFDSRSWQIEPWPITEHSQLEWDTSRAVSGQTSLRTTIDCVGWGGAITLHSTPTEQPPTQGMSVSILCEAQPGATGVPNAKLEVYRPGDGEAMGSPDTPLRVGEWTTITVPASAIDEPSSGCGVVFLQGDANGPFNVWVDAIMRDGEVWEDFEYADGLRAWSAANISGSHAVGIVGPGQPDMPDLTEGHALALMWREDSDGAEIKSHFDPPADLSEWRRVLLRAAVPSGAAVPRASFWLWDGSDGSLITGQPLSPAGEWVEIEFDLAAAFTAIDAEHIVDLGLVFHEYSGSSGTVFVDRLEIDATP